MVNWNTNIQQTRWELNCCFINSVNPDKLPCNFSFTKIIKIIWTFHFKEGTSGCRCAIKEDLEKIHSPSVHSTYPPADIMPNRKQKLEIKVQISIWYNWHHSKHWKHVSDLKQKWEVLKYKLHEDKHAPW